MLFNRYRTQVYSVDQARSLFECTFPSLEPRKAMTAPPSGKNKEKTQKSKPTPEEIERLRAERAIKKAQAPSNSKPVTSSQTFITRRVTYPYPSTMYRLMT